MFRPNLNCLSKLPKSKWLTKKPTEELSEEDKQYLENLRKYRITLFFKKGDSRKSVEKILNFKGI